jgi:small subunit ribosomal protein S4e
MAKMGGSKHLKRLAVPRALQLPKKGKAWVVKAMPGPHPLARSIPLAVLLRDHLKVASSLGEASKILARGGVLVDGRPVREAKFAVGLMDVVSLPALGQHFRILLNQLGKLVPHPVEAQEASFKLCRVERKKSITGGKVQVGLHDGRTLLLKEPRELHPRDVLKLSLPQQEVLQVVPFKEGSLALVIGGKNVGKVGKIVKILELRSIQPNTAVLEGGGGERLETIVPNIFVIGEGAPLISLP